MAGSACPSWSKKRWMGMPQPSPAAVGFEVCVVGRGIKEVLSQSIMKQCSGGQSCVRGKLLCCCPAARVRAAGKSAA